MSIYVLKNPRGTKLAVTNGSSLYFHKIAPASNNPIKVRGFDITPESVTTSHTKCTLSLVRLSSAGTFNSASLVPREHRLSGQACPGTFSDYATSDPTIDTNGDIYTWDIPATAPFVYRFPAGEEPVIESGETWCFIITATTNGMSFNANTILENGV